MFSEFPRMVVTLCPQEKSEDPTPASKGTWGSDADGDASRRSCCSGPLGADGTVKSATWQDGHPGDTATSQKP